MFDRLFQWKIEYESSSFAYAGGFRPDFPPVCLHPTFGDGQPEPCPLMSGGIFLNLEEAGKNILQILGRNAAAVIFNGNLDKAVFRCQFNAHASPWRGLERVGEKVGYNLRNFFLVAENKKRAPFELDLRFIFFRQRP